MNVFVVNRTVRRRLLVAVWVIALVPVWYHVQSWIVSEHADNVLALLLLPALRSAWASLVSALVLCAAVCYMWMTVARQLPVTERWGRAACWAIVVGKTVSVLVSYHPLPGTDYYGAAVLDSEYSSLRFWGQAICSLAIFVATVWVGVLFIRRYGDRIKAAGIAVLAGLLIASVAAPILADVSIAWGMFSGRLFSLVNMLCAIVPYVFLYRAFAER